MIFVTHILPFIKLEGAFACVFKSIFYPGECVATRYVLKAIHIITMYSSDVDLHFWSASRRKAWKVTRSQSSTARRTIPRRTPTSQPTLTQPVPLLFQGRRPVPCSEWTQTTYVSSFLFSNNFCLPWLQTQGIN